MLDVNFRRLIAREGGVESRQQSGGGIIGKFLFVIKIRGAALFAEEEPVAAGRADGFAFVQVTAIRREPGADADHDDGRGWIVREPEMFGAMDEGRDARPFLDALGKEARANAFTRATKTDESDIRHEEMR